MDDLDPTTLILIAVVAVLLLKPDLLSGLFGGQPSATGGGVPYGAGGPFVTLQPPPPQWPNGGHATPPTLPGEADPTLPKMHIGDTNVPGWSVTAPSQCGFTTDEKGWTVPVPCPTPPQATPAAPAAVGNVKAAAKRDRIFTPLGG